MQHYAKQNIGTNVLCTLTSFL